MNYQSRMVVCLLLSLAVFVAVGSTGLAKSPPAVPSCNTYALNLYNQLAKENPDKNVFFSPLSIDVALAMTAAGARGETAEQMLKMLQLEDNSAATHKQVGALVDLLNGDGKERPFELAVANRLWGQKGFKLLDSYLDLTRKEYGAELGTVDFVNDPDGACKTVNTWVEEKTNEKIKDLIKPEMITPLTRLILTNAIYFKGDWASAFKKSATREQDFYLSGNITGTAKIKVPMMYQKGKFKYFTGKSGQYLVLPYKGDRLSMLVHLPPAGQNLKTPVDVKGTIGDISKLYNKTREQKVRVFLPTFRMETTYDLVPTCKSMGMTDAFTGAADFSGMDGKKLLYISNIVHKAFVNVDEKGTEAAAATAVVMTLKGAPRPAPVFRADRPFIFLIRDDVTGAILFVGRVNNPSK